MIIDERLITFINSFDKGNSVALNDLEQEAKKTDVPIIRVGTQSLLRFFLRLKQPRTILEVGTATGFSALFMAEHTAENCMITTIEKYEKRIPIAKDNFKKFGMERRITLLEGDATDILHDLNGEYDLIFMDAAKGQYLNFLPDVIRLLAPGGLLISDNVLQDGEILESRYAVTRRNRTIHSRMRDYLYEISHNEWLETLILPTGDGTTVSLKREAGGFDA